MKHIILAAGLLWTAKPYEHDQTKFELCDDSTNMETWKNNDTKLHPGALVNRQEVVIKDIVHTEDDKALASLRTARTTRYKQERRKLLATFNTVLPEGFTISVSQKRQQHRV